ncbi:MAG: ATP-binding cassette domain-containing protein [Fimbriimonadales bacterium]
MRSETLVLNAEAVRSPCYGGVRIERLNLRIHRGELVALFGPSGSGKSLLLALLAGDVALEGGLLESVDPATMPELPQGRALRTTTAESLVRRYASSWTRAIYLLEVLGLGEVMEVPLSELSDGQRGLLRVGCALAQNSALYLLDDPLDYADFERRRRLWAELDDRCRFGSAVLLTTRDPAVARRADRVVLLDRGRLIADDTPQRLLQGLNATRIEVEVENPDTVLPMLEGVELRVYEASDGYRLTLYAPDTLALKLLQMGYGQVRAVQVHEPDLADAWQWFHLQHRGNPPKIVE